jgi:hypothetical protein
MPKKNIITYELKNKSIKNIEGFDRLLSAKTEMEVK